MFKTFFGGLAAILVVASVAYDANAATVTTETTVKATPIADTVQINFSEFDVNKDGKYSKAEVGERLFKAFDKDGNGLIDHLEWPRPAVFTISPMEKKTYQFVDVNDDGIAEVATYTNEEFMRETGLTKFDKKKDGLSAKDFIGQNFKVVDDNKSGTIDMEEWKETYLGGPLPVNEPERYNK